MSEVAAGRGGRSRPVGEGAAVTGRTGERDDSASSVPIECGKETSLALVQFVNRRTLERLLLAPGPNLTGTSSPPRAELAAVSATESSRPRHARGAPALDRRRGSARRVGEGDFALAGSPAAGGEIFGGREEEELRGDEGEVDDARENRKWWLAGCPAGARICESRRKGLGGRGGEGEDETSEVRLAVAEGKASSGDAAT